MISIRSALEADAPAIAGIHVRGWRLAYRGLMPAAYLDSLDPEEWSVRHRGRIRAPEPGMTRWIAERDGAIVGFAVVGPARDSVGRPSTGEVHAIYVEPSRRREGVGRALLEHAADVLREDGHAAATLWVLRDNAAARRFYQAMGWCLDGREKPFVLPGFESAEIPEVRYGRSLA